jgi:Fis1-like tetratricopeptide repeat protein
MPTVQDAFARGDFLSVARAGAGDTWQYWASLGLLGHPADAAGALQRFAHSDAGFYSAAASWMAGDDDRALHGLDRCDGEHARRLAALIRRRPITILAQLPWGRTGAWDLVSHMKDPAFRLFNVSFHRDDIANRPYADVMTLVPEQVSVDFFVAEMVEWHLIPPNVRALGCPVIGHTSDFDLHVQTILPWLDVFDELIVLDDAQWREMTRLTRVPVSVYAKVFGVPSQLPQVSDGERPIDVYLSGTVSHPYHVDKDPLVRDVLSVPDAHSRIVNGFEAPQAYYKNLLSSKICCTFVRHPGAMPTRGLEALGVGCAVVIQNESALRVFAGETAALVSYDSKAGSVAAAIQKILAQWPDYDARARAGAAMIRREFALDRVASQYFRFLTVLAAKPRTPRRGPSPDELIQRRPVVQKGWLPSLKFGQGLLMDWAAESAARIEEKLKTDESARLLNDVAREHLLAHYHDPVDAAAEWLEIVVSPLGRALEKFPAALVPRFNLARVLVHFGDAADVRRGVELIEATLRQPIDRWHVDVLDDVLPWDFCPSFFNYRRYFDTVVRFGESPATAASELIAIIVASLSHYRARYAEIPGARSCIDWAREAVRLDPDSVDYVLYYCRQLIARAGPTDMADASTRLEALTRRSARLLEMLDIARHLPPQLQGDWYAELETRAARFWSAAEIREYVPEPILRAP